MVPHKINNRKKKIMLTQKQLSSSQLTPLIDLIQFNLTTTGYKHSADYKDYLIFQKTSGKLYHNAEDISKCNVKDKKYNIQGSLKQKRKNYSPWKDYDYFKWILNLGFWILTRVEKV